MSFVLVAIAFGLRATAELGLAEGGGREAVPAIRAMRPATYAIVVLPSMATTWCRRASLSNEV
jgi:hypothetical protein